MKKNIQILIFYFLMFGVSSAVLPAGSVYDLETTWTDENGQKVKLSDYRGKPLLLSMVYTTCPHTCPLIIEKIREITQKSYAREGDLNVVLMTFDPDVDTPRVLSEYKKKKNLSYAHWHFLRGSHETTRMASVLLNVSYQKDQATGTFTHDNKIFLLNGKGEIVETIEGLDKPITPIVSKLLKEKSFFQRIKKIFQRWLIFLEKIMTGNSWLFS